MTLVTNPEALAKCRPRHALDLYPTDPAIIRAVLSRFMSTYRFPDAPRIIEPGIGFGPWGRVSREIWPGATIIGTEIRDLRDENYWASDPEGRDHVEHGWRRGYPTYQFDAKRTPLHPDPEVQQRRDEDRYKKWQRGLFPTESWVMPTILTSTAFPWYDRIIHGDFFDPIVEQTRGIGYDLCVGNPAYNQAEEYVRRGMELVRSGGYVVYLLLLNFLAGQDRATGLYQEYPLLATWTLTERPSFTGRMTCFETEEGYLLDRVFVHDGKTDAREYAIFIFQKGVGERDRYTGGRLSWKPKGSP